MKIAVWLAHSNVESWNFSPANRARLASALPGVAVELCPDAEAFVRALADAEVAVGWRFRQEWFAAAPRLQWFVTPSAGRDYFEVSPPPGVTIGYSSFHGELMAETVLGMMLASCRGILDAARLQEKDPWPSLALAPRMRPLRGARLVILGFGHIGEWIARLAKPLGVCITGIRRHPVSPPAYFTPEDRVLSVDRLDEVLPEADHLALALPRSPETDHILDARRLALLSSRAFVYNVGRGNAIDEQALARALGEGRLAGAALDVFATEPLPMDSPLRSAPNLLIMPHSSAVSPNYLDLFLEEFIKKFHARYKNT
ncbi:MAG: D-2-hydroxyacid dehydrogenase [Planctomycetota bacterium]